MLLTNGYPLLRRNSQAEGPSFALREKSVTMTIRADNIANGPCASSGARRGATSDIDGVPT
jgi:hypothetical protein